MKIKDILKKQGEIYKNLTSNETIKKFNETIEPPKLVPYKEFLISEQEYEAMRGLEKMLNKKPVIVNEPEYESFEISINNNQITYINIGNPGLTSIPKEISCFPNLQILHLDCNQISKIENFDKLQNLQELWLSNNKISKSENLDNLPNLQILYLSNNQITKLENLDNLPNLQILFIDNNQITKLENLDNLPNLQILWLQKNPIKNKEEIKKLRKKVGKVYL